MPLQPWMLRAGIGALFGGAIGSNRGVGGVLGGAAAGAGAMFAAPRLLRNIMNTGGVKRNFAGMLGAAFERMAYPAMQRASIAGNRSIFNAAKGLRTAGWWMGQNKAITNKIGGAVMAGLGTAAAAKIGSTILGSNQPR